MQIVLSSEPDTILFPSGEKATEATSLECALIECCNAGQLSCPPITFAILGNFGSWCSDKMDFFGKNGTPDRYKCGVLCRTMPPKIWVNLIPSLAIAIVSWQYLWPCPKWVCHH